MQIQPTLVSALIVTLTLPAAAHADALFERYRAASEAQAQGMADFMVSRVPELAPVIPPIEWSDEANAIGVCVMDSILADRGPEGLEAYVVALETMAAVEITSMTALANASPEILNDPYFTEVAQTCGAMDFALSQMQESGLFDMITQPAVMDALAAD